MARTPWPLSQSNSWNCIIQILIITGKLSTPPGHTRAFDPFSVPGERGTKDLLRDGGGGGGKRFNLDLGRVGNLNMVALSLHLFHCSAEYTWFLI